MIKFIIYLLWMATIHALWEIQVEGKTGGWARHLPTFRINVFFNNLLGGKALTGYHLFMLILFITIFHGFFLFQEWTPKLELVIFGIGIIYFVVEDFLWFVLNKHYGIKRFRPGKIAWHNRWVLGLPISYWVGGIIVSTLLHFGLK